MPRKSDKTRSKKAKVKTRAVKQARELKPSITFVGGKWYNEHGKEVPKPQPQAQPQAFGQQPSIFKHPDPPPPQPFLRYDEKRIDGCTCSQPSQTGHVPGCRYWKEALYNCELAPRADLERMVNMDAVAPSGAPMSLERLQLDRLTHTTVVGLYDKWDATEEIARRRRACSSDLIQQDTPRRRCWLCPFWDRHKDITPFDHQKLPQQPLGEFPHALDEEDDDLPF